RDAAAGVIPSVQTPEPVRARVGGADGATAGKAAPTWAEDATPAQADTLEAAVLVATASPVDATAAQSIPAVAPAAPPSPPPAPSPTLPDSVPMATGAIPTPVGQTKGTDEATPADLLSDVLGRGGRTAGAPTPGAGRAHGTAGPHPPAPPRTPPP